MGHATFKAGDLEAVIGDNEAYGEHRAGYNGIHALKNKAEAETPFVPTVAGLNLEHIFDGDQELRDVGGDRKIFFEPRNAPMKFRQVSETEAELHQEPTPTFQVESWTTFQLAPPHAIDFTFRCRPTQHVFRHDYIGLFWASYIHGPDDRSMYFRDQGRWMQICTPLHNVHSTVTHRQDNFAAKMTPQLGDSLYQHYSPLKFDEYFFYGLFRKQVLIFMFDPGSFRPGDAKLRLTHSPSGGGHVERQTSNPAWDFQFLIPVYEVLKEYGFRGRMVYRPHTDRAEILKDVAEWRKGLS